MRLLGWAREEHGALRTPQNFPFLSMRTSLGSDVGGGGCISEYRLISFSRPLYLSREPGML